MAVWGAGVMVMALHLQVHEGQLYIAAKTSVASSIMSEGAEKQRREGLWWMKQGELRGEWRIEGEPRLDKASDSHACFCL